MKIAQIAPPFESVPPRFYGGTERVVSYLTEELVNQGHDVTLYASGDSVTAAHLRPYTERALRLESAETTWLPKCMMMLDDLRRTAQRYDVVHFHIDCCQFPSFRDCPVPTLTTLHGRQDLTGLDAFYRAFPAMPLVTISDSQALPIPHANVAATIHHGLPINLLRPVPHTGPRYLAFLGRISPEKGLERAIEIARAVGMPLKIAAKVDRVDEDHFNSLRGLISPPMVEFVGEINEQQKESFLGQAAALLFPIDWPEPFGLVMIEAMACGTPVLAFNRGSVSEVVDNGVTGAIVDNVEDAIAALPGVLSLSRSAVRARFEERFSAARMASDYVALYEALSDKRVIAPTQFAGRTVVVGA
jgi:glycosyltransferase involved in cell wall biosynthesis